MQYFKTDLHIHTCLSPCADIEMSPKSILKKALEEELKIIGICDHNSAENVSAFLKLCEADDIYVIGGMEVTTEEEVHVLVLFDSLEDLLELQNIVYEKLPEDERFSEEQIVVNEYDEIIRFNKKLLISSSNLSMNRLLKIVHERDGIAIASHVDRESFSITGQLGFIPDGMNFDALEIMEPKNIPGIKHSQDIIFITSSDAHYLKDIGSRFTTFLLDKANFKELRDCLRRREKWRVII